MDYMYAACSTTARRGALDWAPKFEAANKPVFEELYRSVKNGDETRRSLSFNGRETYSEDLAKELAEIDAQEIWRAGKTVRVRDLILFSPCSLFLSLAFLLESVGLIVWFTFRVCVRTPRQRHKNRVHDF